MTPTKPETCGTRMATEAERIVFNCTGRIEHIWQRRLVEKIDRAIRNACHGTGKRPEAKEG
jgi:hypothetical protein